MSGKRRCRTTLSEVVAEIWGKEVPSQIYGSSHQAIIISSIESVNVRRRLFVFFAAWLLRDRRFLASDTTAALFGRYSLTADRCLFLEKIYDLFTGVGSQVSRVHSWGAGSY